MYEGNRTPARVLRLLAACLVALFPAAGARASTDLRPQIYRAFSKVTSYRVTVLGSVRSLGVWVAPNRYQMTTDFEGKPVKTIIIGRDYWTLSEGKWEKSGTASNNLDVDISGLLRVAKKDRTPFVKLPDQTQDDKAVGTFSYHFPSGTDETCNYDLKTFLVTRCKADELTLLYSGYNDPANRVATPK